MHFLAIILMSVSISWCCIGFVYKKEDYVWGNNGKKKHGETCLLPRITQAEIELNPALSSPEKETQMTLERCNVKQLLQCLPAELDEYAVSTEDPTEIREGTCKCTLATGGKLSIVHPTKGCRIPAGQKGMSSCRSSEPVFKAANFNTTDTKQGVCTDNAECRRDGGHAHYWCHCQIGYELQTNGECSGGRRQALLVSGSPSILLGSVGILRQTLHT